VGAGSIRRSKLDVESTPQPLRVKQLFANGYTVFPHALDGDTWGRPVSLIVVECMKCDHPGDTRYSSDLGSDYCDGFRNE
jgi:hypothetical protein